MKYADNECNNKHSFSKEEEYSTIFSSAHLKKYGQFFTPEKIAKFMVTWSCTGAKNVLDPAVGNSIFLKVAKNQFPNILLDGYEIDNNILNFFGNPALANIKNKDFLLSNWNKKYDAIICNPPYNRFQAVENREEIINVIHQNTGILCTKYTNLYILFLIKSIYQLSSNGRLSFLIPSEFLNSNYGKLIKEVLIQQRLLKAIINFKNDSGLFSNALTTSCLLLLDRTNKSDVDFYNLEDLNELEQLCIDNPSDLKITIPYEQLSSDEKWRKYLKHEKSQNYSNLKKISDFCYVTRGIATGDNNFFCLNKSKINLFNIPDKFLTKCICHSSDVNELIFNNNHFNMLANSDKYVFVLDVSEQESEEINNYLSIGIKRGVNKKYLVSHRKPWFSMERKNISPIWISSVFRDNIKFIRNKSDLKTLTTFHSMYINKKYTDYTNIIFCYFLTPIAQKILKENRKELGNGLKKFQPNDINSANMLDITLISDSDKQKILEIYNKIDTSYKTEYISEINSIVTKYV